MGLRKRVLPTINKPPVADFVGVAAKGYLKPVRKRRNLTIVTRAHTTRILFEGKQAVGINYSVKGKQRQARARKEVLLSAEQSIPRNYCNYLALVIPNYSPGLIFP